MARFKEIKRLEDRRQELLAESQQLRSQLRTHLDELRAATGWIKTGTSAIKSARPYWPLVALISGFLLTRKRSRPLSLFGKVGTVWQLASKLIQIWQQFSSKASPPAQQR